MTGIDSELKALLEKPLNQLTERAMNKGMIPVGYACSMVPEALISAGKLFPVRMRAPGIEGTEMADLYLSSVVCTYARSLLEFALDDRYSFLGGYIFTAGCDHLRRLHDNLDYLKKPGFSYILDIPHKTGDAALEWTIEELNRLASALEKQFDTDMSRESISKAIEQTNALNRALSSIGAMRKSKNPPFTGTQYHRLIMASKVSPAEYMMPLIEKFHKAAENSKGISEYRARLMIAGSGLDDPEYTKVIESQGALVVADRYCTGSFPGLEPVDSSGDPFEALARTSLGVNRCPRMMEGFNSRAAYIAQIAEEYSADGVIIESIKFCDTWGVESAALADHLRAKGIPVLRVEREYRQSGEGQLRTRVQAFIESIGK
jgi:benzoyl-CoA reductase/2-hydroxyglutaryl-CoA dehydratase subunit BcrC/BadD/HgdB